VPDVTFRIAGDGPMRAALERRARERDVTANVEFVGHCEDVPALLAGSDAFALPSRTEAFPNGLLEAMAAGLPAVASAVGGIPELIEDGANGLLVAAGDAPALADALVSLLGDSERATTLGRAARETVVARYSFERMAREFTTLYVEALASRGAGPDVAIGEPSLDRVMAARPHAVE
jgi:glycosyltransferase involved in cell wall biosynthesis